MDLAQVKLMFSLKDRVLPTEELVDEAKTSIENHTYPIGVIATNIFAQTTAYKDYSITDNHNFCSNFITAVFSDYYTQTELDILSYWLLQAIYIDDMYTRYEIIKLANSYLFTHSDKKDVEFCLNTLRYLRLTSLLYTNEASDEELINDLFEELEDAEEEYNNTVLGENYL